MLTGIAGGQRMRSRARAAALRQSRSITRAAVATQGASVTGSRTAFTENGAVALDSSGEACVDFLFTVVPGISRDALYTALRNAWDEDPLATMKLLLQLGDPREGKSDRDNHQLCLLWIWRHFPATALANIRSGALAGHTCLKGLLDLLMYAAWDDETFVERDLEEFPRRGTVGPEREYRKRLRFEKKRGQRAELRGRQAAERVERIKAFRKILEEEGLEPSQIRRTRLFRDASLPQRMPWMEKEEWTSDEIKARFVKFCEEVDHAKNEKIHQEVKKSHARRLADVGEKYSSKPELKELYDTVADVFAEALKELMQIREKYLSGSDLSRDERLKLTGSLYPKWAPTSNGMHDKKTDIVRGLVERIFPAEEFQLGTYEHYISFMKDKYRKEVLSPLRRHIELPESFIGAQEWEKINYNRMSARCRLLYGQSVYAQNDETYEAHLKAALEGTAHVKGNVMPDELVSQSRDAKSELQTIQAEAQWKDLVSEVKAAGVLGRALAVCDTSGSMWGQPMDVAVALSLLISEVTQDPWRQRVCSFSADPYFVSLPDPDTTNLAERAAQVLGMHWGMNTNFEKVFERILDIAVQNQVPGDQLPELLVVFSDMQFDESISSMDPWATTHEKIKTKFRTAGYGEYVPKIIYWNLRYSSASGRVPTPALEKDVVMLSGYSQGLLKSFLKQKLEAPAPLEQMSEWQQRISPEKLPIGLSWLNCFGVVDLDSDGTRGRRDRRPFAEAEENNQQVGLIK